jgi:hypothetical protein
MNNQSLGAFRRVCFCAAKRTAAKPKPFQPRKPADVIIGGLSGIMNSLDLTIVRLPRPVGLGLALGRGSGCL